MFKKTLIAAALATATMGASAYEIGQNNDFAVEVYGVAATSVVSYSVTDANDTNANWGVENESRIGFRAGKEMVDGLTVFMQVESGYVDNTDWGHGGVSGGVLGFRDTFIGLKGDGWGQVRVGRVLTPMYEIVDWPFSNPGLGSVFDWGGLVANYDRQSNQIRYDAPTWGGFTFAASVGTDAGKNGGGPTNSDSIFYGANARYAISIVNLMAGIEMGSIDGVKTAKTDASWEICQEADVKAGTCAVAGGTYKKAGTAASQAEDQDRLAYILGAEIALPGGFGLAAAYKQSEIDGYNAPDKDAMGIMGEKVTQGSYSVIAQYWNGPVGFKLGYAANLEAESNGVTQKDTDANTISGQLMGSLNGFVPYVRVAGRTVGDKDTDIVTRVGIEYGF